MRDNLALPVAAALIISAATPAWGDAGAFRGPYLNDVTSDAITVMWESPVPTTGIVRYGIASPSENVATDAVPSTHHEVRLTALSALAAPGSRFVYELEVDGDVYPGSFRTAVVDDQPFAFIVYGDNRSSEVQHQAVVDALMAESVEPHFAVSTGDAVSDGEIEAQWDDFFRIEAPFLARTPIYLAIGNHEVHDGSWPIPERVFAEPLTLPPASPDEAFYHLVHGNAEIIVINVETHTLFPGLLAVFGGDQEPWLTDVLANPPAGVDHRFLLIHQGPYSSKPGRNGNFWLRAWLEDFKSAGIDAIISGHDHYVERGFAVNGIHYLIHGGGGAPLYETLGPRIVADHTPMYGETRLGYLLVEVDGARAELSVRTLDGTTIDSVSYGDPSHPAACATATDCGAPPTYGCPDGSWECVKSACRYTCSPDLISTFVTCLSDTDCEDSIGSVCEGSVHCEMPDINPLEWHCLCDVAPQCVSDANCTGLDPPIEGCEGTWACVDEVCEFAPTEVCEPPPDAGPPPSVDAAPPVGQPDAAGPGAPDAGSGTPGDGEDSGGCGCRASGRRAGPSIGLWLAVALIVTTRRRRARRLPGPSEN